MKLGRCIMLTAVSVSLATILPSTTFAKGKKGSQTQTGQQPQQQQQTQDNSAFNVNNTPTSNANDDAMTKASAAMDAAAKKARATFEATPDWKDASDAFDRARDANRTATVNVTTALKTRPDYVAGVAAKTKAEDNIDTLRNSGTASADQIITAANSSMDAKTAVTQLETSAMAADPTVIDTKTKLAAATTALADQRKKEELAVAADPDYITAKKDYDDAKSKLASAAQ